MKILAIILSLLLPSLAMADPPEGFGESMTFALPTASGLGNKTLDWVDASGYFTLYEGGYRYLFEPSFFGPDLSGFNMGDTDGRRYALIVSGVPETGFSLETTERDEFGWGTAGFTFIPTPEPSSILFFIGFFIGALVALKRRPK